MEDGYIDGNTTTKITVTNSYSYNISVKAWMIHPDIIEWMRPNRTLIENISWITIKPSRRVIPAKSNGKFYIHLSIPNETRNQTIDKHWETWAAFKINSASENSSSSFNQGYLVRVYVDTPKQPTEPEPSPSQPERIFYDTLIAIVIAIIITTIFFIYMVKKRRQ